MACRLCFTGGSKDLRWDDVANVLYANNGGCGLPTAGGECLDNATREAGCNICPGCAYTGTDGSGAVSCYSNVSCSTPCSGIPDLPGAGMITSGAMRADTIFVWTLAAALFMGVGLYWLRKQVT